MTDAPLPGRPPVDPASSEAGRLLCAGAYLDRVFRDRVIEELYVHSERIVAPSYGFDAARVLAHALRARRLELGWAALVVALWTLALLLLEPVVFLVIPCLGLTLTDWLVRRTAGRGAWHALARLLRNAARVQLLAVLLAVTVPGLAAAWIGIPLPEPAGAAGLGAAVCGFGVIGYIAELRHKHVARILGGELSPQRYAQVHSDPAEHAPGPRFRRVRERIRREQHQPLILYSVTNPMCGAGQPFRAWSLSGLELRPRGDLPDSRQPTPLDNTQILGTIREGLQELRVPGPKDSPQVEAAVLDRLRELVIEECVFVPALGLPHRDAGLEVFPGFDEHRRTAIEEAGERRRHYLRIRVSAWDEGLVLSVFVRVHTQGGMLMVEFAPHVLLPVRTLFQSADAIAGRYRGESILRPVFRSVTRAAHSLGDALILLVRAQGSTWRLVTEDPEWLRRTIGPEASVRELGSEPKASIFHDMDIERFLKAIQERVVGGVSKALHEAGWQTQEFERQTIRVEPGAVFIQSVNNSSFGIGGTSHNSTNNHHGDKGAGHGA
ncbi:hypothetical protein [Streptomyces sp. NPDC060031]|uniref:hypothetical protein n=1 Tax=Streptomyces sp. NPDC060031 TaxID=3347043 RepID=UPI0036A17716